MPRGHAGRAIGADHDPRSDDGSVSEPCPRAAPVLAYVPDKGPLQQFRAVRYGLAAERLVELLPGDHCQDRGTAPSDVPLSPPPQALYLGCSARSSTTVRAPDRAAALAAERPAGPAPMTATSHSASSDTPAD